MRGGSIRRGLLSVLAVLLAGCAGGSARPEPSMIIIHNSSSRDLARVTLREVADTREPARLGSISPVPRGVSQTIIRPRDPEPLPGQIEVVWVGSEGSRGSEVVSLTGVLRGPDVGPDMALYLELGVAGEVTVLLIPRPEP